MSHTDPKPGRILRPVVDKGSPVERRGRKASGLRDFIRLSPTIAGLPRMNLPRYRAVSVVSKDKETQQDRCIVCHLVHPLRQSHLISC